ncbi:MAG: hypothetical protein J6K83_04690 [Bacteroidaceae bacterium]|nr:hypothetical protein [Bacteroidaceae bacterium]
MSLGEGSQNEIVEAASLLTSLRWAPLILQEFDIKHEASMKNHLVFSPEFLSDVAKKRSVYKRAKEYAKEQIATQRGGDVKLCTKCIKGEGKVIYAMRHRGGSFNVAAVAEVNGLINLSVIVKDTNGNESKPYKTSSEEFKGASFRKLENIQVPKGNSKVYISIENKSKKDRSVAIIVE